MATQADIDAVLSLLAESTDDQVTARIKEEWPSLLYGIFRYIFQMRKVDLDGADEGIDAAAGILDWTNPFTVPVLVRLTIDLTTPSTGACTADFGTAAGSTTSDNLIDGVDLNAGAAVLSSDDDQGTNGRTWRRLGVGEHVTGSMATGSAADIAGSVHIEFRLLDNG